MRIGIKTQTYAAFTAAGAGTAMFAMTQTFGANAMALKISVPWHELVIDWKLFAALFASLFAIMNPIVGVPLFTSMTEDRPAAVRRRLAGVAALAVFLVLGVAATTGTQVLNLFAIGIPSFRIAGGIIVLSMGLAMLASSAEAPRGRRTNDAEIAAADSQAICPLAIPLLAGPGAIATVILASREATRVCDFITLAAVIICIVALVYVTLRAAGPIARFLGATGLMVVTRLIGMILAAIAIDMAIAGLKGAFPLVL